MRILDSGIERKAEEQTQTQQIRTFPGAKAKRPPVGSRACPAKQRSQVLGGIRAGVQGRGWLRGADGRGWTRRPAGS